MVVCNKDGDTPLMMLVRKNDLETATLLLDHGADPNSVDGLRHYLLDYK